MKRFISVILLMAGLAITFSETFAQVPKILSYQGVLTDTSGTQVPDGPYQLTFNLYDQQSGGSSLWTETQTVNVEKGVFGVVLGKAVPFSLGFDNSYWLGITVELGSELLPRTELTASAYSLNAAAISDSIVTGDKIANGQVLRSLNGLTDEVNLAAGPNIIISPQGDSLVIAAVGGSGSSPWQVSGNNIYYNLGRVGIGTANPEQQLHITGNLRVPATASGGTAGVILSDTNRLIHNYGIDNFFAGVNAGNFGTSGERNTGIGSRALLSNTTGTFNTAIGALALDANSTGSENNAVGVGALTDNTTGVANTAIGTFALKDNLDGNGNTAVGSGVMLDNTSGSNNTAVGVDALRSTTGDGNTGTGDDALRGNTTGSNNTAYGRGALASSITGNANTAIGSNANVISGALNNATAIGANATVDASNKIRLGDSSVTLIQTSGLIESTFGGFKFPDGSIQTSASTGGGSSPWQVQGTDVYYNGGDVGIGVTDPGIFSGGYRYLTLSASQTYTANRTAALELQGSSIAPSVPVARIDFSSVGSDGPNNIARIQAERGNSIRTGELVFLTHSGTFLNEAMRIDLNGNVGIGTANPTARVHSQSSGGVPSFLAGGSSADFAVPSNNQAMQFGNWDDSSSTFSEWMRISSAGNIGIGITNPSHPLHMGSGAHVTSGGVWTNASSRAFKDEIHSLSAEDALSTLDALEPVSFYYKADRDDMNLGFIAEDVPDLVATKERKGLSPMDIVAVLTKVVQQQQKRISELESRINGVAK